MIHYLIDGMLSGSGVRDAVNGGYVDPAALGLSAALVRDLSAWQRSYEEAHFDDFPDAVVAILDSEGLALAARAARELAGMRVGYFSDARMKRLD